MVLLHVCGTQENSNYVNGVAAVGIGGGGGARAAAANGGMQ